MYIYVNISGGVKSQCMYINEDEDELLFKLLKSYDS